MRLILHTGKKMVPLLVLLMFLTALLLIFFNTDEITGRAKNALVELAKERLGEDIQVGRLTIFPLNRITLHQVRLMENGRPLIQAERISVSFFLGDLLKGTEGIAQSIKNIQVVNPELFLQKTTDGGFGFEKYLEKTGESSGTGSLDFYPTIHLSGGKVHYRDEKIDESLENLQGSIMIRKEGISLDLKGVTKGPKAASFDVNGSITPDLAIDVLLTDVPLVKYSDYGIVLQGIDRLGGKGSGKVHIEKAAGGSFQYSGQLTLVNGMVAFSQIPTAIDQINGQLRFQDQQVWIDALSMRTAAGKVKATGEVSRFSDPDLMLSLTTDGLDLGVISELIPDLPEGTVLPTGILASTIEVNGNWQNPQVKAVVEIPELAYADVKVQQFSAKVRYQDSFLTIQEIKLPINEGSIQVYSGYVSLKDRDFVYSLNAEVQNIHLHKLLQQLPLPVELLELPEGVLDGKLYLSGDGFTQDRLTAIGFVNLQKLQYQGIPVDQIKSNFWFTGGELGLSKLEIIAPYLQTTLTGHIDLDGEINLQVEPSSIDLSWFGKQFDFPAQGMGTLQGDIKGKLSDPYFLGEVQFARGQVWDQGFDQLVGRLKVTKDKLILNETSLVKGSTSLRLTGQVGFMEQNLSLSADIVHSSLQDLQEMLDFMEIPFELSGKINGQIRLTGPWSGLQVDGDVMATQGKVIGQPYDRAQMTFTWKDSDILLKRFTVSYNNTVLQATGTIDHNKEIDIDMEGQGFDLNDIEQLRTTLPSLVGRANFLGKLSGSLASPAFTGTISSNSIKYNEVPIEQLSALLAYSNNILKIRPAKVVNGVSEYTLVGEVNFTDKTLEMQVKPRQVKVSDLLRYIDLPLKKADYALDGEIWLRGPFDSPRVEVDGMLTDSNEGTLEFSGIYEFSSGMNFYVKGQHFDLAPVEQFVKIDNFKYSMDGEAIVQGTFKEPHMNMEVTLTDGNDGATVALSGAYNLRKGVDLRLKANQFNLVPFKAYLPVEVDYTGRVNASGSISGTIDDLDAALELELLNGSFNGNMIQRLGGTLQLTDSKIITLDQELALPDGNEVRVNGTVPLQDANGPLNLDVTMKQGNLEMLTLLVPGVEEAGGGGKGQFKVTGTLKEPVIDGELNITGGHVKYQGIDPVKDVRGKILLSHNKVNIEQLSAKYGQGTVSLTGSVLLESFMPQELDLKVKTKDFHFVYGSIDAFGDTDSLTIKGPFTAPEIRGPITVHDAEVGVIPFEWPVSKGKSKAGEKSQFAPTFYLELYPGENVQATGASPINMNITVMKSVTDALVVDTTGEGVILTGELSSRNGTFNFYNANFRVTRASASFVKFNKYIPIIRVQAQTTIDKYRVYLDLDGLPSKTNQLKMTLYSDPALTEQQVMSLLMNQGGLGELLEGGADVTEMISDEIWRFINQGLRNEFLNKLETSVERVLNLDTFQVDTVLFGDTKVNVQIGKFFSDKFYVVYNRTFSQEPEQSIGFEYQIRQNISLEGSYKGPGDFQVGLKANFPF